VTAVAPAFPVLFAATVLPPQFVFFLIIGVMWLFKAIGRAKAAFLSKERPQQEADRPKPAEQAGPVEMSLSDEERALLVRQDILQKRAKRQAEIAALMGRPGERPAPAPPPLARKAPADTAAASAKGGAAAVYAAVPARAPVPTLPLSPLAPVAPAPSAGALWLDELRSRDSVRRAILVREILGQPVALR
jgi:hypothetical protein